MVCPVCISSGLLTVAATNASVVAAVTVVKNNITPLKINNAPSIYTYKSYKECCNPPPKFIISKNGKYKYATYE